MKISFGPSNQEVKLQDIDAQRHYIGFKKFDKKGFIMRSQYKEGKYRAISLYGLTYCNEWDMYASEDLHGMIESMKDTWDFGVFTTSEDMLKWLIE